jgi:hypothetical protein
MHLNSVVGSGFILNFKLPVFITMVSVHLQTMFTLYHSRNWSCHVSF